jgi:hypothetical protein
VGQADGIELEREESLEIGTEELLSPTMDPRADISLIPDGYEAQEIETKQAGPVKVEFLTGQAGTGKTWEIQRRIRVHNSDEEHFGDPGDKREYAVLCASTGIAAVNLGAARTIHSTIGYKDTESLVDNYIHGSVTRKIADLSWDYQNLVLDEISMTDSLQLDTLVRAFDDAAEWKTVKRPMGLIITGDFCQLPPVEGQWAFKANCWPRFAANVTRLSKVWRQTDESFLKAINTVRAGNGHEGALYLKKTAVQWDNSNDVNFEGTTIMAKNKAVDAYNGIRLDRLAGTRIHVKSLRWGRQRTEWTKIPDVLELKIGAYVMILNNDSPAFTYVNGDCGHIVDFQGGRFRVKLVRDNGREVLIPPLERGYEVKRLPDDMGEVHKGTYGTMLTKAYAEREPFWDDYARKYVLGQVKYYPLRLAYAATVHKTQGLSLDKVQMNVTDGFFGAPAMTYVALSRARTPQGLRIVGGADLFAKRVKFDPEVEPWL